MYQPTWQTGRHLPHVAAGGVDLHRQRPMCMDRLRGTAAVVSSFETTARRLPEADLYFWLDVMAVFDNADHTAIQDAPNFFKVDVQTGCFFSLIDKGPLALRDVV